MLALVKVFHSAMQLLFNLSIAVRRDLFEVRKTTDEVDLVAVWDPDEGAEPQASPISVDRSSSDFAGPRPSPIHLNFSTSQLQGTPPGGKGTVLQFTPPSTGAGAAESPSVPSAVPAKVPQPSPAPAASVLPPAPPGSLEARVRAWGKDEIEYWMVKVVGTETAVSVHPMCVILCVFFVCAHTSLDTSACAVVFFVMFCIGKCLHPHVGY